MTLEQLILKARAEGVTMIVSDKGRASCWNKKSQKYFQSRSDDHIEALRDVLEKAIGLDADPDILV